MLGPRLCAEEREDPSPTPNVQDDLVLEQELVLVDGVLVRLGAHCVLKHLLVDAYEPIEKL